MRKYFILWLRQLKNGLAQRMAYPINFFVMCFGSTFQVFLALVFINVIFGSVNYFVGWTKAEAMIIVASYMIVEGLLWATVAMLGGVSSNIRSGFFDILLTKPVSIQFMVSVWRADPEDWMRVVTACFVLFHNVPILSLSGSALMLNCFIYLIMIINSYFIVYSIFLMVKAINFWTFEGRSVHMVGEVVIQSSKYPVDIFFHKIVRVIFSSVIPLAFIATVPAQILIHGPKLLLIIYSTSLALIFFYLSRRFFLYGLKHYESVSS